MNLDDHVQMKFAETFGDFANETKPLVIWRGGYAVGFTDGFMIKENVEAERARAQQRSDRDIGHNQGLAHAAFVASHCTLPVQASEAEIRDFIVHCIEAVKVDDAPKANGANG